MGCTYEIRELDPVEGTAEIWEHGDPAYPAGRPVGHLYACDLPALGLAIAEHCHAALTFLPPARCDELPAAREKDRRTYAPPAPFRPRKRRGYTDQPFTVPFGTAPPVRSAAEADWDESRGDERST
jgi:hypothetical protein